MCDCIKLANNQLAAQNTRIVTAVLWTGKTLAVSPPRIATEKIDQSKRGKAVTLYAAFCPICGARYD